MTRLSTTTTKPYALIPKMKAPTSTEGTPTTKKGGYDTAIEDYNDAIRIKPQNALAYNNRGITYRNIGDYDRAIEDYTEAISLDPQFAVPYANRGNAYGTEGEYDTAILDLNEAVRLRRDHALIYLTRGIIYQIRSDNNRAIEDYDNAVRLCPNYQIDLIDHNFFHGGEELASLAVELLDCVVEDSSRPKAFRAYYAGVKILLQNNRLKARRRFETARRLGFEPAAKIVEHLENLNV